MTGSPDYRLYLQGEFKNINDKLDKIKADTQKTNDRVTKLEDEVNELKLKEVQHIINCPVLPKVEKIEDDVNLMKGERQGKASYREAGSKLRAERRAEIMKTIQTISVVIAAIGLLFTAYNSIRNNTKISDIDTKVDMINTPVRTRSGVLQWYPSGIVIDSLNQLKDTPYVFEDKTVVPKEPK